VIIAKQPGCELLIISSLKGDRRYIGLLVIALFAAIEAGTCLIVNVNIWFLRILTICNIYALYSISWEILLRSGQISFGHSLYFGGGAYTSAMLNYYFAIPMVLSMAAGVTVALVLSLILSYPLARLRDIYFGLTTLSLPMLALAAVLMFNTQTGGEMGLYGLKIIGAGEAKAGFLIVLMVVGLSAVIILLIDSSNLGLILRATSDDEVSAESVGIDIVRYRRLALVIGGGFAALAGVIYVHFLGGVSPLFLEPMTSFLPVIMVFFGGAGTLAGAFLGAYVITFLNEYLLIIPMFRTMVYGAVMVVILRFAPGGMLSGITRLRNKLSEI
jgi:branched-chain amino acid transport system permease protein